MTHIERVLPADLQVGDRIFLHPLHPYATRPLTREEHRAAGLTPVAVTGFGAYDRTLGAVLVRTGIFNVLVPVEHRVAVVGD